MPWNKLVCRDLWNFLFLSLLNKLKIRVLSVFIRIYCWIFIKTYQMYHRRTQAISFGKEYFLEEHKITKQYNVYGNKNVFKMCAAIVNIRSSYQMSLSINDKQWFIACANDTIKTEINQTKQH